LIMQYHLIIIQIYFFFRLIEYVYLLVFWPLFYSIVLFMVLFIIVVFDKTNLVPFININILLFSKVFTILVKKQVVWAIIIVFLKMQFSIKIYSFDFSVFSLQRSQKIYNLQNCLIVYYDRDLIICWCL